MNLIWAGFLFSYNPFFIHFLMKNGALGGTRIRFSLLLIFTAISIFALVYRLTFQKFVLRITLSTLCVLILAVGTIFAAFWGYLRGNTTVYFAMDLLPLVEFFVAYFLTHLSLTETKKLVLTPAGIRIAFGLLACTVFANLTSYFYLTYIENAHFGALRAYINGRTINRLMDFIVPCFAPFFVYRMLFRKTIIWEKILTFGILLTTFLSFYRTLYLAVFIPCIIIPMLHVFGIRRRVLKRALLSIAFGLSICFAASVFLSWGSDSYFQLIIERFTSIYYTESALENSKASRFDQLNQFAYALDYFPLGHGMGASIGPDPVSVMFNYFMQIALMLGVPFFMVFMLTWMIAFKRIIVKILQFDNSSRGDFYRLLLSILFALFIILNIFPYMAYFPFLYIFGSILAITEFNVEIEPNRVSISKSVPAKNAKMSLSSPITS